MNMRAYVAIAFVFVAIAVLHCGGRVDGANSDGGSCSASVANQACSNEGATCTFDYFTCNQPGTGTCFCAGGYWSCEDAWMQQQCPSQCPMDTSPGMACSTKGLQCEAMMMGCNNQPVMCTCDGSQFGCPIPDCPVQIEAGVD